MPMNGATITELPSLQMHDFHWPNNVLGHTETKTEIIITDLMQCHGEFYCVK